MQTTSSSRRELAALYDDRAAAERARSALLGLGIPAADIRLVLGGAQASEMAEDSAPREEKGFFEMLADLFMPDEDRSTYAEGLNRGSHLLTVTVPGDQQDAALDILDNEGAVDMDDRVTQWQGEGWTTPGRNSIGPGAAGSDPVMGGDGSGFADRDDSASGVTSAPNLAVREAGILSSGAMADGTSGMSDSLGGYDDETTGTRTDDDSALREVVGNEDEGSAAGAGTGMGFGGGARMGTGASGMGSGTGAGFAEDRAGFASDRTGAQGEGTIRRVEERLAVGKRDVSLGRVRVRSYVIEEPVTADVSLRSERVQIDRRAVDRPVSDADDVFQDRTIEVEEMAEEPVIQKTARVVEEIDVSKAVDEQRETVSDTVRRTEVEIDDDRDEDTLRPLR